MTDVGNKIRERRLALNMTQEELAHKVGYKTKASINKLETSRDMPIKKLKPIADALDIDIKELMGWDEPGDYENVNTDAIAFYMKEYEKYGDILDIIKKLDPVNLDKLTSFAGFLLGNQTIE